MRAIQHSHVTNDSDSCSPEEKQNQIKHSPAADLSNLDSKVNT